MDVLKKIIYRCNRKRCNFFCCFWSWKNNKIVYKNIQKFDAFLDRLFFIYFFRFWYLKKKCAYNNIAPPEMMCFSFVCRQIYAAYRPSQTIIIIIIHYQTRNRSAKYSSFIHTLDCLLLLLLMLLIAVNGITIFLCMSFELKLGTRVGANVMKRFKKIDKKKHWECFAIKHIFGILWWDLNP